MPHKDPEARRKWAKKWYEANKDKVKAWPSRKPAMDRYRAKHKDKLRKLGTEYYWDNKKDRLNYNKEWRKQNGAQYERKRTESLNDTYIRKNLIKKGWARKALRENPELIEVERTLIKIKRLCKTSPN